MSFSSFWKRGRWQMAVGRDSIVLWDSATAVDPVVMASAWPRRRGNDWTGLATLASVLLQQEGSASGAQLDVVLAWHWHRALNQPWRDDDSNEALQAAFSMAFGVPVGTWRLRAAATGYRQPRVVFGIEKAMHDALETLALQGKMLLTRVEPAMLAGLRSTRPAAAMVVLEPGSVLLLQAERGHLRAVVSERWEGAPGAAVEHLWRRTQLRQPALIQHNEADEVPVWDLRMLHEGAETLCVPAPFVVMPAGDRAVRRLP